MNPMLLLTALTVIGSFLALTMLLGAANLLISARPSGATLGAARAEPVRPQRLAALAAPSDDSALRSLHAQMLQAGLRGAGVLATFFTVRVVLALALPCLLLIWRPDNVLPFLVALLALASTGYYLPWAAVSQLRSDRQRQLSRAFPDALDMLVSCVESGLSLDAALNRVASELQTMSPELAHELSILNAEVAAGIDRADALDHLGLRTGLPEIEALGSVLGRSTRFGAGVASSLRAHSQLARRRRALEAERRAAEAAPKLTVAMILFILPPLFVVLLGPTVINIVQRLMPVLTGMSS